MWTGQKTERVCVYDPGWHEVCKIKQMARKPSGKPHSRELGNRPPPPPDFSTSSSIYQVFPQKSWQ